MHIWDNVRADLGLRNLTIYAQWASILAAMLLYITAIRGLFSYLSFLISTQTSHRGLGVGWIVFNTLDIGAMKFLFPLAPLALDLPQYIRRNLFLYISTISWFAIPLRHLSLFIVRGPAKLEFIKFFITIILMMATFLLAGQIWTQGPPRLGMRVGVNIVYCGQLVFSMYIGRSPSFRAELSWYMCVLTVYHVAASLFGIAALLYGIAWTKRHTWVSSRSLGGTGIEPMVLMLPGRGPLYQSVGDEAREGAIRLV